MHLPLEGRLWNLSRYLTYLGLRTNTVLDTARHIPAASSNWGMHCEFTFLLDNVAHLCPHVSLPEGTLASILIKTSEDHQIKWHMRHTYHTFRRNSTRIVDLHAHFASQGYLERCIDGNCAVCESTVCIDCSNCVQCHEVCCRWTIRWFGAKLSTVWIRCHYALLWIWWGRDLSGKYRGERAFVVGLFRS